VSRLTRTREPTLWEDEPTWSVAEICQAIDGAVRQAFPTEVWLRGEIRNLKRGGPRRDLGGNAAPGRGWMVWFDLVEPAPASELSRPPVATLPVVLFDAARRQVNTRLRQSGDAVRMEDGTEVRIRGRLGWWAARGRLQLQMTDIDPEFTLGRLAADREKLLRKLDAEGLLRRQRELAFPAVPLTLGLVTSAASAAEHDVLDELRQANIGFRVLRADVGVQGRNAPRSVAWGLRAVAAHPVDAVLLVRGGGASTELATFDSEIIARAIAELPVPVITGIGHDIDRTVADEVAHASYKTPTACAQAVVAAVRDFDNSLVATWSAVAAAAHRVLNDHLTRLQTCARHVALGTRHGLAAADQMLSSGTARLARSTDAALTRSGHDIARASRQIDVGARAHLSAHQRRTDAVRQRLTQRGPRLLDGEQRRLEAMHAQVRALDPARALARGWSITRTVDGELVRSPQQVTEGQDLETTVAGGTLRSTVNARQQARSSEPES
jgi:exodeoxyribonuclease VII large subunit